MRSKPMGLILAGGRSQRLFPLNIPKPLLEVHGRFLLSEALERLKGFDTYVIANRDIAKEIVRAFRSKGLRIPKFLIEPVGRDTAAAVGFGIRKAIQMRAPWVAVLSADHWMPQTKSFPSFLRRVGKEVACYPDALFVSGSAASTKSRDAYSQFGWIVPQKRGVGFSSPVENFVEKPSGKKLEQLLKKRALINGGVFFGKTAAWKSAFKSFFPDVLNSKIPFETLPRMPVDKAIFERFENVRVIAQKLQWEDLGTWEDWARLNLSKTRDSKLIRVPRGSGVFSKTDCVKEIYAFGVSDLAIIESAGKLLVMPLSESRHMKTYLKGMRP